jgi:eukaryotic translation initiation factor 2C
MSVPVVGKIPFMIFGADVTHPTSFNENDPSIAAVCASYDRSLGRYMSRVLRQVGAGVLLLRCICMGWMC